MKITICAGISSTPKIKEIGDRLMALGYETKIPFTSRRIIDGELSMAEYLCEKEKHGDKKFRNCSGMDFIKSCYELIKKSDAILVLNIDKNGIKNYIGGNVLIEIGFAYVLNKKIYFYNDIPQLPYADELIAMKPIVITGDLRKII